MGCRHADTNNKSKKRQHKPKSENQSSGYVTASGTWFLLHSQANHISCCIPAVGACRGVGCEQLQALFAEAGLTEIVQMLKVASGAELEHDK